MRIESLQARRVFRLAMTIAVALTTAYALAAPLPYLAPLFALLLTAKPGPPIGYKAMLILLVVVAATLGIGVILGPLLSYYPFTAVLIVGLGIFVSSRLKVIRGKLLLGTFLIVGVTMISAASTVDQLLAVTVIQSLVFGILIAILSSWLVYPLFPENAAAGPTRAAAASDSDSNWIALRATLIILPVYLLTLTNPAAYMPIIMKSVSLGQQSSDVAARDAGRVLLGSTFLGGCFAVLFWFALSLWPSLWMFFLWMLLFAGYCAAKLYRAIPSRLPPAFWQNVVVTLLILLGPAVQDTVNGKDVYTAFVQRMGLFVAVTLYAWAAIVLLEHWRSRRDVSSTPKIPGTSIC
jgi:hypothetical protein